MAGVTLPIIVGRHPVFVVERDAGFGPPHVVYLDLAGGAYVRPETGGLTLTGSLTDDETQHPMDPEALGGDVGGDEAALTLERTARSVPRLGGGDVPPGLGGRVRHHAGLDADPRSRAGATGSGSPPA